MFLATQQVEHVPGFITWMLFGRPSLLAQSVDLDVRLYYAAVQNLVYGCGNVPQTTAKSSENTTYTPKQHVQQSVICPSSFPQACNSTPFEWLKFNRSTYSSAGHGFTLGQRFSNYGPRTTCGPRDLPLWSFKEIRKKNSNSNDLRITL